MRYLIKTLVSLPFRTAHPTLPDMLEEKRRIRSLNPQFRKLAWEAIPDCPIARVEPACVTVGGRLYVIAGYHTLDHVVRAIDVLDLPSCRWEERIELPAHIPQTHQGVAVESGRYLYSVAGQVGIQCSPCVPNAYVLDLTTRQWSNLPSIPKGRYAPAVQLWNGRLHLFGGSTEDRVTPASDHWSLGVRDGRATEETWREEPAIPRGGPHRSSIIVDNRLFALGCQIGDRPAIPGDPKCRCDWSFPDETFHGDSFVLEAGQSDWRRIADMPIPATHTEYGTLALGKSVIVLGGFIGNKMMTDVIQAYDTSTDQWQLVGRLPTRNKGCAVAYQGGWLYVVAGQKEVNCFLPTFGDVLSSAWRTRFQI